MDMVQISSFVKVAEERSFTRAAQQLFVAKSALSRRIRDLEAELGTTLLERGYHSNNLTHAGEKLLPMARELVQDFDNFARVARESTKGSPRTIVIGFPPLLHPLTLKAILDIVKEYIPEPMIKLRPYPNSALTKCLLEHDVDLALIHEYVPCAGVNASLVLTEEIGAAIPKGCLNGSSRRTVLEDLASLTYVTSENMSAPVLYKRIDILMEQAGIVNRLELPHHELQTVMNLVISRMAFALCPLSSQSPCNRLFTDQAIEIVPLHDAGIYTSTYVGWSADGPAANPVIEAVVNDVTDTYRVPMKV